MGALSAAELWKRPRTRTGAEALKDWWPGWNRIELRYPEQDAGFHWPRQVQVARQVLGQLLHRYMITGRRSAELQPGLVALMNQVLDGAQTPFARE